jgi:hypothetical protein
MADRKSFQNLANRLINVTFGGFRDDVILEKVGAVNYANQSESITSTVNTKGIRIEYSKSQFGGSLVQIGDYMVIVEQQSVDFDVTVDNVKMTFNGKAVNVINVTEDAARAVLTMQVRDL